LPLAVIISFLARLLGLGGISEKIKGVIKAIQSKIEKALDKVVGFVVGKAKKLFGKLTGKGKEKEQGKDKSEQNKDAVVVTTNFSLTGASHKLTTSFSDGNVQVKMASVEKDLLAKLADQKKTEEAYIKTTTGAEQKKHQDIKQEIEDLESWQKTEMAKLRKPPVKPTIRQDIAKLNDQLMAKIVALGNKHGLKDLIYKVLNIQELLDKIDAQVKELRKHLNDANKPGYQGDGHSNSAMAAEVFGWSHAGGQHGTRAATAEPILNDALTRLDEIKRDHGVDLTADPIYIAGKQELDDTRLAKSNPKQYLMGKSKNGKPLWYSFFPTGVAPNGTKA
jgi:hypothetical protein